MLFLVPPDFEFQVRSEIKALLKGQSQTKLLKAETAAAGQMRNYLRRYDLDRIFLRVKEYRETSIYYPGDLVYYYAEGENEEEGTIYTCHAESSGQSPDEASHFTKQDPRNAYIIMCMIDLLLYHLHSGTSTRAIPEHRYDRYQEVLEWLKGVSAGEIEADLPVRPPDEEVDKSLIRFSSHPKENHRY